MSHLFNPLATATQLYKSTSISTLPIELQDSIRFYTARLTQSAGILLRLPQDIVAKANVLLFRYWVVDDLMGEEFSDVSAAIIYLTAKTSPSPRSLRSITNVYAYLLSPSSPLTSQPQTTTPSHPDSKPPKQTPTKIPKQDPESYYLSESQYIQNRTIILHIEGQILNALSFNLHVSLPHPLAITYLQTLDIFSSSSSPSSPGKNKSKNLALRTIQHLNTALLSPQMLYLTHQPCALATAAIYLAAREVGVRLPEVEWWEVFDCEREELGFLVVGMGSLEGVVEREVGRWRGVGMIGRGDVKGEMERLEGGEDEESEMGRMLDGKAEG